MGSLLLAFAAIQAAQPASPPPANPRAAELFERDWVLMQWARRIFDADRDGILSLGEAQGAAQAFREIADGDLDGRVTPYEYGRAREFILARY
ncbi:MAG TPA: hypothetical protein VFK58_08455 [Sphingomicrobium sp.]|nr:hypothetical protein [Sphingomicrobium sp.]